MEILNSVRSWGKNSLREVCPRREHMMWPEEWSLQKALQGILGRLGLEETKGQDKPWLMSSLRTSTSKKSGDS